MRQYIPSRSLRHQSLGLWSKSATYGSGADTRMHRSITTDLHTDPSAMPSRDLPATTLLLELRPRPRKLVPKPDVPLQDPDYPVHSRGYHVRQARRRSSIGGGITTSSPLNWLDRQVGCVRATLDSASRYPFPAAIHLSELAAADTRNTAYARPPAWT